MAYNLILRKLENAVVLYLQSLTTTTPKISDMNIVCGKASVTKSAPLVVVYAESAKPDPESSGNSDVTLHVMVKSIMAVDTDGVDPVIASDLATAVVFDAMLPGFNGDDLALAALVNGLVDDFTIQGSCKISEDAGQEEDAWVETLTLRVYCTPSDV